METVFDSSMLGIEPYSREVTQNGELLVMDSMNSNIYRMALPLSRCACALAGLLLPSPGQRRTHISGQREAATGHL